MHKYSLFLLPVALTACGEGSSIDESVKTRIRQQLVATCTATAQAQVPEGVTVDLETLCTCAADKWVEGKSAKDLVTNPPTSAEDLSVVQQCVKEIGPVKIDTTDSLLGNMSPEAPKDRRRVGLHLQHLA